MGIVTALALKNVSNDKGDNRIYSVLIGTASLASAV